MNVSDIKSADRSLATANIGDVVEGIDDINQCIVIILSTKKGSDPFRPDFGSNIWEWIDRPLPLAVPNMKRAIFEAIGLWEQRVIVTKVEHAYQNEAGASAPVHAGIRFNISWKLRKSQTTGAVEVTLGLYDALVKNAQKQTPILTYTNLTTENQETILAETGENIVV